jgi:hypothetical protein
VCLHGIWEAKICAHVEFTIFNFNLGAISGSGIYQTKESMIPTFLGSNSLAVC